MNDLQRLDKWLWHARFFKTRTLATRQCANGRVRINRIIARKPSAIVRIGDVLTFPQSSTVRVVKVMAVTGRREPAPQAVLLYNDLASDQVFAASSAPKLQHGPRPTKFNRRAIERFKLQGFKKDANRGNG